MEAPQVVYALASSNLSHPSCSTAKCTAKVIVQTRYESPYSINEQPLFNSPAKHSHLPVAARGGDEASLPGGRLAV